MAERLEPGDVVGVVVLEDPQHGRAGQHSSGRRSGRTGDFRAHFRSGRRRPPSDCPPGGRRATAARRPAGGRAAGRESGRSRARPRRGPARAAAATCWATPAAAAKGAGSRQAVDHPIGQAPDGAVVLGIEVDAVGLRRARPASPAAPARTGDSAAPSPCVSSSRGMNPSGRIWADADSRARQAPSRKAPDRARRRRRRRRPAPPSRRGCWRPTSAPGGPSRRLHRLGDLHQPGVDRGARRRIDAGRVADLEVGERHAGQRPDALVGPLLIDGAEQRPGPRPGARARRPRGRAYAGSAGRLSIQPSASSMHPRDVRAQRGKGGLVLLLARRIGDRSGGVEVVRHAREVADRRRERCRWRRRQGASDDRAPRAHVDRPAQRRPRDERARPASPAATAGGPSGG